MSYILNLVEFLTQIHDILISNPFDLKKNNWKTVCRDSENHKIRESLSFEGTSYDHLVNSSCSRSVNKYRLFSIMLSQVMSFYTYEDYTISLWKLFPVFDLSHSKKVIFLYSGGMLWFLICAHRLLFCSTQKRVIPHFSFPPNNAAWFLRAKCTISVNRCKFIEKKDNVFA